MKKMKKILATLLALTMVLGMSLTSMAAETGAITVNGLNANEETTVKIYAVVTLNDSKNDWTVAEWAASEVDKTKNPAEIDWDALEAIVRADGSTVTVFATETAAVNDTSVEFTNLPIGAYLIIADGTASTYKVMGSSLYAYDTETNLIIAPIDNPIVWAKYEDYKVTKEIKEAEDGDNDTFVGRGDEVEFNITTAFPSYEANTKEKKFTITDTPTGLNITNVSVKVGTSIVTEGTDYNLVFGSGSTTLPAKENEAVTVSFTESYIGEKNAHAGQTVVVTITAKVTDPENVSNKAETDKADTESTVQMYTGDATITKYAYEKENDTDLTNNEVLSGAEFQVYTGTKDSVTDTSVALYFVKISDGVYKLAESTEADATQTIVATTGTVQIKGLDEGTYWFKETKAPAGYTINEQGVEVTIVANAETPANVSVTGSLIDSKLIALPSTGGIGTTIFTVAGCGIMIAAAFFFFASRKKENN